MKQRKRKNKPESEIRIKRKSLGLTLVQASFKAQVHPSSLATMEGRGFLSCTSEGFRVAEVLGLPAPTPRPWKKRGNAFGEGVKK